MSKLFMYDNSNIDYISTFQMELGYTLRNKKVMTFLLYYYGDVNLEWGDFSLKITVGEGVFEPLEIIIEDDYLRIKKIKDKSENAHILLYNEGYFKSVRQDKYCSFEEYDLLDVYVASPLVESLRYLKANNLENHFITEKDIKYETGYSKKEHNQIVKTLEHFVKDIYEIYKFNVKFKKFEYFTLEFYLYARLGKVEFDILSPKYQDCSVVFDYIQEEDYTKIVSDNQGTLHLFPALLTTAYRVHSYKAYTLYDRKLMQKEYENLVREGVLEGEK